MLEIINMDEVCSVAIFSGTISIIHKNSNVSIGLLHAKILNQILLIFL